jgi:DNA-binding MarR family transcriptional regulator
MQGASRRAGKQSPGPQVTLIGLFRRAARLMVDDLVQRLAAAGYDDLPAAYHPIFENIDPGGTQLTVLAGRAGMTHQSMGELIRTLEARGYVERVADPHDGRARLVRLTAKGRQMVRTALAEIAAIEQDWLGYLSTIDGPEGLRDALGRAVARASSTGGGEHRAGRSRDDG